MEQITLTGSFTHLFDQEAQTFFIGQSNGRYGIIAAGSWETILPFCFDQILSYPDDLLSASHNGASTLFHLIRKEGAIHAVPVTSAAHSCRGAICLPA